MSKKEDIKRATLDELCKMYERGETSPDQKPTEEVELPDDFWNDAKIVHRTKN